MGANGKRMRANVWNAGIFVGPNRQVLEAHLIGFTGDLYGKEIEIEIEKKIREVIRFENDEKLREQIRKDINNILANESE
jgi:riboflavin kinase/FMN adenylyltransferase